MLHKVLGLPLSNLSHDAALGRPLASIPIWGNEHDESAAQLRAIIAGTSVLSFELHAEEGGGAEAVSDEAADDVLGMLDGHDERVASRIANEIKRGPF